MLTKKKACLKAIDIKQLAKITDCIINEGSIRDVTCLFLKLKVWKQIVDRSHIGKGGRL